MIAVEQARHYLEPRGCSQAAAVLDSHCEAAAHAQRPYAEFLADRLGVEVPPAANGTCAPGPGSPTCRLSGPWSSLT